MRLLDLADEAQRWNAFVAKWPDFELMQCSEWGEFKRAMGWRVVRIAVERDGHLVAGAQMLLKPLPLGLASIAYIPRGPLLDWDDGPVVETLLPALHASALRHRAILLKIEPAVRHLSAMQRRLQAYGFHRSNHSNQPQCSMLIDLTPDIDAVLANMHKTTRYNIRYSARKGVRVREATEADLDIFYRLIKSTADRAGFPIRSQAYYRQEWDTLMPHGRLKLFLAMYNGEVIAARMPAAFGGKAASLHSGSFSAHRHLKPNELLMWESIQWAKSQGCTLYDVWGIPSEVGEHVSHNKPLPQKREGGLWGVYSFKRGFGGDVVYYVGAYDYVYSRSLCWLINVMVSCLGSLDKVAQLGDRFNVGPGQPRLASDLRG